jgi:hypothetical protein
MRRLLSVTWTWKYQDAPHELVAAFPIDVGAVLSSSDLLLQNETTDAQVPASSITLDTYSSTTRTATFRFPGVSGTHGIAGVLPDANYRAYIHKEDVGNLITTDALFNFHFRSGDANGDRAIDFDDYGATDVNFLANARDYRFDEGDFDATRVVDDIDSDDYAIIDNSFLTGFYPPPTEPDTIAASALSTNEVFLEWGESWVYFVENEEGWRLQRSTDGVNFTVLENLPPDTSSFTDDQNVQDGTRYWYRVPAYHNNPAHPSNTAYTPKRGATTAMLNPSNLVATTASTSQINLTWNDNTSSENSYVVQRSLTGQPGSFTTVATLPQNSTGFSDLNLSPGTTYHYRVFARNGYIDSAPSNTANATTGTSTTIDLDAFEDVNNDGVHDNSTAAEQLEATQPTAMPYILEEDGELLELALIVAGATATASVTFNYSSGDLQLYRDLMLQYPINPGTAYSLANHLAINGSGTVSLFGKVNAAEGGGGVTLVLGNGSTGSNLAFGGGTTRRPAPADPDQLMRDGQIDDLGGLDDGDGPGNDPLTDRDSFWTRHAGKNTLIIGFSGNTQSKGSFGTRGQIWQIDHDPSDPYKRKGVYELGQRIAEFRPNWAVSLFPEDPGNDIFSGIDRAGDGVIGRANPTRQNQRVDANGNPTGALPFFVDAIKNRGIRKIGLFGYSHGGGAVDLLMKTLAYLAQSDVQLRDRLTSFSNPVKFFWSAYIDAVNINYTTTGGVIEATGTPDAETSFPRGLISGTGVISTLWHYNAYQLFALPPFGDGIVVAGTELNADAWGLDPNHLRQDYCDIGDPRWPNGLDHTQRKLRGIAENVTVQDLVFASVLQAINDTYND